MFNNIVKDSRTMLNGSANYLNFQTCLSNQILYFESPQFRKALDALNPKEIALKPSMNKTVQT